MKTLALCWVIVATGAAAFLLRPGETLSSLSPPPVSQSALPPDLRRAGEIATPLPQVKSEAERAADSLRAEHLDLTPECFVQTAARGSVTLLARFLETGFCVDERDASGRTALMSAAGAAQVPAAKALLSEEADANACDDNGFTPLMAAAKAGSISLVDLLLDQDALINSQDHKGMTALAHAIASRQAAAANTLVARHADVSLRDVSGRDAFDLALEVFSADSPLARTVLAAGAPRPAWTAATREALLNALQARDATGVRLLLAKHTPPPTLGEGRQTVLAYAVARNDIDQLRMLLDCGADPNIALKIPAEQEFVGSFRGKMLNHYLTEEPGMTPLMLAAASGRADLVEALLDYGAKRGAETKKYRIAALSFASWADDVPSMLLLLGKSKRPEDQPLHVRISLNDQRAYVYDQEDKIVMTSEVSTGKPGFRTPTGSFVVTDKHSSRFSSIYKCEMPFFMRLSCSEVGMHAGVVPGHPASHGCVRMPRANAAKLFRQLEVGTPVTIVN